MFIHALTFFELKTKRELGEYRLDKTKKVLPELTESTCIFSDKNISEKLLC